MNYEQENDCHFSVLRSSFKVQLFTRCGLAGRPFLSILLGLPLLANLYGLFNVQPAKS
jgi:hypothetical protein